VHGRTVGKTASMPSDCYACQQAGPDAPFRERFVRDGGWRVAHDFNSSLAGWLILVPLRHLHALDELAAEEALALGDLLRKATAALRSVTGCEKTYVMLFAEAEGFAHLHVHVVPRMSDQPADRRGPDVFGYLRDGHALSPERRDEIARDLLAAWPSN
jgi:diadenosine tetraphosphate (Ap4A) HIT family hydrolase